jgi:hypothetical protein
MQGDKETLKPVLKDNVPTGAKIVTLPSNSQIGQVVARPCA